MRTVLIVGAGQAGLQLAQGLLKQGGYEITVISARTPDEIRTGGVMSTQFLFGTALRHESEVGADLWADQAIDVPAAGVSVLAPDGSRPVDWTARFDTPGQSVDQRLKMAGWLERVEELGGRVVYRAVSVPELDALAANYELVLIAAGRNGLAGLFERDAARSPYVAPQRALAAAYLTGMRRRAEDADTPMVRLNLVPGVGEMFEIPALSLGGPCDILFLEGIKGGPWDCWAEKLAPGQRLARLLELLRTHAPSEYDRYADVALTDQGATLVGEVTPVVRQPIGRLAGGRAVLGLADAVVTNDPLTAQGANGASKCAATYLAGIVGRGDQPFDEAWMCRTFDAWWAEERHATEWTNLMLRVPPEPHLLEILGAAGHFPAVATRFVNGFDDPADVADWLLDADRAARFLGAAAGGIAS